MHKVMFIADANSDIDALCWECMFQKVLGDAPTLEECAAAKDEHDKLARIT